MTTPCLLVIDPPADGAWNMAVDEALLERAARDGKAALRFYQWREPTLSLGYAQRYADRAGHPTSQEAPCVRRLSGGGALVHDRELTYSLCLPASYPLRDGALSLYAIVHETLIEVLDSLDVHARLHGADVATLAAAQPQSEHFLCFARRGRHDIVLPPPGDSAPLTKIVGSAQRRSRGAVLQHGVVLLEASSRAPELPGIRESTGRRLAPQDLIDPWSARLASRLKLILSPDPQNPDAWREAAHQLLQKYAGGSWTKRR